jgi:hypothetical protein
MKILPLTISMAKSEHKLVRMISKADTVDPQMSKLMMPLLVALLFCFAGLAVADCTKPRVVHVVLVWLNEPGNEDHKAQIIEATRGFSTMPGVEEIRVGGPVSSDRAVVDDSFDIGLYITFSSKEALQTYLDHPQHKAAQQAVLRPLAKKAVVYDFQDDGK